MTQFIESNFESGQDGGESDIDKSMGMITSCIEMIMIMKKVGMLQIHHRKSWKNL